MSLEHKLETPIAVIGLGAVMPDANHIDAFWQNIISGVDSIRDVPADRWAIADHYDPDPKAPDKSYTKIGSFVRDFNFNPIDYRIPPRVALAMDDVQKWAIEASRQALQAAGYLDADFDRERAAVVMGNALAGELHYLTAIRVHLPRFVHAIEASETFRSLPEEAQASLVAQFSKAAKAGLPQITPDSMPGELSNVIAGRIAQTFGFRGPNFTTDAACASSLAALQAAVAGLIQRRYDLVITGGVDSSMSPQSFVKFSKVGALSPDLSCPFDARANGFVMGEGCGVMLLKRLDDALRDSDQILAVVRGVGSSSDGRGKGITAPNPIGQRLAVQRAFDSCDLTPSQVGLIEAHGTSTSVGDVVEAKTMSEMFSKAGRSSKIPLGSIKSQIGHLKSAAGAASLIKAVLSLHHKTIPVSLNFETPNPNIGFEQTPFYVPTQSLDWEESADSERVCGVSAFGFGGTNFHALLSEVPKMKSRVVVPSGGSGGGQMKPAQHESGTTLGRQLAVGADTIQALGEALATEAEQPEAQDLAYASDQVRLAPHRVVISWQESKQRSLRSKLAQKTLAATEPQWRPLASQGVFYASGPAPKVAFLFPGQGSQYVGMLGELAHLEPVVAEVFKEADSVMQPILGRPLTDYIFTQDSPEAAKQLLNTTVCQPAVLAVDIALARLLVHKGIQPDMTAGHSLGEYAALVASGMLSMADALLAVSARAREMSSVKVDDPGKMAAVFAPADQLIPMLDKVPGVVPANYNSPNQTVIAGYSKAIDQATAMLDKAGVKVVELPVSHAFHSFIVAQASEPLRRVLGRLDFRPPRIPLIANLDAEPYADAPGMISANLDRLAKQVASPVRWVEIVQRLYAMGARLFVEVGPKKVLTNFVLDILDDPTVTAVCTNHPKQGDLPSFQTALAACAAYGLPQPAANAIQLEPTASDEAIQIEHQDLQPVGDNKGASAIVVSGVSMGLPGEDRELFAEDNADCILNGYVGIDSIPLEHRQKLVDQNIVRLVKDAPGGPAFVVLKDAQKVARLTGRKGRFDLSEEFGLDPQRVASFDVTTRMAIAAGLLALRDAQIPLVMHHKETSTGKKLPIGWRLPQALAEETGIIFASAFPGYEQLIQEMNKKQEMDLIAAKLNQLRELADEVGMLHAVAKRIQVLEDRLNGGYEFDRKFIFRALSMGHTQLAEVIGARGPNIQVNAACSSTTSATAIAADWIQAGRCKRVLVVGADDITNPTLSPWLVGGLLATGAVTTEPELAKAALPFDRRRNGMIPGMGAVGLVIEDGQECEKRGITGLTKFLGAEVANSAFHGSRLHPEHIAQVMDRMIARMEQQHKLDRSQMAQKMVFVSHETYTPARGGSASAEVQALRRTFGEEAAHQIVISNTKGYTGHPMAVGIEDASLVHILQRQQVPPIANHAEQDPELGPLNLSKGGHYDVQYALRLSAGFGSQVAISLHERLEPVAGRIVDRDCHQNWLRHISGLSDPRTCVENKTLHLVEADELGQAAQVVASTASAEPVEVEALAQVQAEPIQQQLQSQTPLPEEGQAQYPTTEFPQTQQKNSLTQEEIINRIVGIVAQKTGYPEDMLEPDLDLEADLGIDTVCQAEMFSEIRAAFSIPKQDDLKLSDYPTLGHIIEFAKKHASFASDSLAPTHVVQTASQLWTHEEIANRILGIVAQKTGYPEDMLEADLDLEADLGIDTVCQAEMFSEIRAAFAIPKQDDLKLSNYPTLGHIINFATQRLAARSGSAGLQSEESVEAAEVEPNASAAQPAPTIDHNSGPDLMEVQIEVVDQTSGQTLSQEQITSRILGIVAQKTGYPEDMLEPDLDLEADLGIDTVCQAEMFSEIRAAFSIPKQEDLKLSDYPTMGHIIRFAQERVSQTAESTVLEEEETIGQAVLVEPNAVASQAFGAQAEPAQAPPAQVETTAGVDRVVNEFSTHEEITDRILKIVAQKTGYPEDMLEPDLDLEADLGIDTVCQAEMFSEIRATFSIPKQDDLKLSDYPTLGHIIDFAKTKVQAHQTALSAAETAEKSSPESAFGQAPVPALLEVVEPPESNRLRYLTCQLVGRPAQEICHDSRVSWRGKVLIVSGDEEGAIALADMVSKQGAVPVIIKDRQPQKVFEQAQQLAADVCGAFVLPDSEQVRLDSPDEAAFRRALDSRSGVLLRLAQALEHSLANQKSAFFICATKMGGHLGIGQGALDPLAGLSSGFTKALSREWGQTLVKIVDFAPDVAAQEMAQSLIGEAACDPLAVEVGYTKRGRFGVKLNSVDPYRQKPTWNLDPQAVVLVFGGTGGIASRICADLAEGKKGIFYLAGRTPQAQVDDPWVKMFSDDQQRLKLSIIERLRKETERVTPVMVQRELSKIERQATAVQALAEIEKQGAKAFQLAVDITDALDVRRAIDGIVQKHGRLDLIVHAAGVDQSQPLAKKSLDSYERIVGVKVNGLRNILLATRNVDLKRLVLFGSIAGRFGNAAQVDYSAANDCLAKSALALEQQRPGLKVLTIGYSAWAEAGMATRGSIPQMMERAGIEMIPMVEGVRSVRASLTAGLSGELVVSGRLGELESSFTQSGMDIQAVEKRLAARPDRYAMLNRVVGWDLAQGLQLEVIFDTEKDPYLLDHSIEGTPIVPGVMAVECFAEAVRLIFPEPGVLAIENLVFEAPLKLYRGQPRQARLFIEPRWNPAAKEFLVRMETSRLLVGQREQQVCHYRARVLLNGQSTPVRAVLPDQQGSNVAIRSDAIYRAFFHGPSFQVLDQAMASSDSSMTGFLAAGREQPRLSKPATMSANPMLTELAFQTAGLIEARTEDRLGLPAGVDRLEIHDPQPGDLGPIAARVVRTGGNGRSRYGVKVVDGRGYVLVELDGYRTSPLPSNLPPDVSAGLKPERGE